MATVNSIAAGGGEALNLLGRYGPQGPVSRVQDRGMLFTPRGLFRAGEQGVWYDPSDLSTLFQDSAGTTPVTASGQPVGLMLDKSKGLARGPELVTNGTFDSGSIAPWGNITYSSDLQVTAGELHVVIANTLGGGVGRASQPISTVIGKTYELTATARSGNGGPAVQLKASVNGNLDTAHANSSAVVSATSTQLKVLFVAQGSTTYIGPSLAGPVGASAVFDNISVRELHGHHATQPTAGSRPIYRRGDSRGVVNLLVNSSLPQGVSSATSSGGTVTSNLATGWAGGLPTTGVNIVPGGGTSFVYISRDSADNAAHTFSAYIKMDDGLPPAFGSATGSSVLNDFTLTIDNTVTNPLTYVVEPTQDPTVFRVSVSIVTSVRPSSGNGPAKASTNSARGFTASGYQLNIGPTALPYQRNDSHLGGVATGASTDLHWLETDGVDDGMVTGNIDFTRTDKVSVFAGVRKLSDGALGLVCELSGNTNNNNGVFAMFAPISTGVGSFNYQSKGTIAAGVSTNGFFAPVSSVLTGLSDIAQPRVILRIDATQNINVADQGTGNYGNYPLYLFRRGGTLLPFNGWFYGLAITGRLTTDAETVATERFFAAKSAVVIP